MYLQLSRRQVNILKSLRIAVSSSSRDIDNFLKKQKEKREKNSKKDKKAEASKELKGAKSARNVGSKGEAKRALLELDWGALSLPGFVRVTASASGDNVEAAAPCLRLAADVDDHMVNNADLQAYLERFLSQASLMGSETSQESRCQSSIEESILGSGIHAVCGVPRNADP